VLDNTFLIENGELIFGIVEKTFGASQGGLVHAVFHKKKLGNLSTISR